MFKTNKREVGFFFRIRNGAEYYAVNNYIRARFGVSLLSSYRQTAAKYIFLYVFKGRYSVYWGEANPRELENKWMFPKNTVYIEASVKDLTLGKLL